MKLQRYENTVCAIDLSIFQQDEYSFSVLTRILNGECRLTVTDKKRLVVCHSCEPYPVWIWLPDDVGEAEKEFAYKTVKENFGLNGKYRFITKYFFAEYMIEKAKEEKKDLKIVKNLFAYNCLTPIEPKNRVDGRFAVAKAEDLDAAVSFIAQFHEDVDTDKSDIQEYRKKAEQMISEGRLFFWLDRNGEKTSMCSYTVSADKGSIGQVFTGPDKRRSGYASNLVYEVTKLMLKQGKIPVLYTDADYIASNACYEGIGYKKQGSACTLQ